MESHEFTWQRLKLIGRGAFGSVFLGHVKDNKSPPLVPPLFAIKSAELSVSASLQKEVEILHDLRGSPYIITCYAKAITYENGQTLYNFMMEYASGGSLADRITRHGCLPVEEVKHYTRQLLLGLAHIHDCGYVHCDIKPDNVLLVPQSGDDFVAKIADFGFARKQTEKIESDYLRGTPSYMAPETVVNGIYDCASDIWALGCVVHEMLTGQSVWQLDSDENSNEIYYKIAGAQPDIDFELPWEAESFLRVCFLRVRFEGTPAYRPTAAMLLEHPFLTGFIEKDKEVVDENGCEEEKSKKKRKRRVRKKRLRNSLEGKKNEKSLSRAVKQNSIGERKSCPYWLRSRGRRSCGIIRG